MKLFEPETETGDVVWQVDAHDRIVGVNEAYRQFAIANDAPDLAERTVGRSLWDFITGDEVAHIYERLLASVRRRGKAIVVPYRCDAPHARRSLLMRITPFKDGMIVFRSVVQREESREAVPLLQPGAARCEEFLRMCSWCNKMYVQDHWREVEAAVRILGLLSRTELPLISHGMCPKCAESIMSMAES